MTTKTNSPEDRLASCVFIHVSHGILGIRRKVSTEKIEVKEERGGEEVDKKQLNVTKAIIDCEEYRLICRAIEDSKSWLRERAIHAPYYREGVYAIPLDKGEDTLKGLTEWQAKIESLADDFAFKAYARAKREAKTRLAHLYNEGEYPSERRVRASIYMDWDYPPAPTAVPQNVKELGKGVFEAEVKKQAGNARQLVEQMTYMLRQQLQELVAHLADRLAPDAQGERKVFRESAITNVTEWLEFFDSKNTVTRDGRMADLVTTLKKQLTGVDVKQLKDDESFRKQLEKSMAQVKANLDLMLKDAPKRLIAGRDEEV